jgi:hypothetical protein
MYAVCVENVTWQLALCWKFVGKETLFASECLGEFRLASANLCGFWTLSGSCIMGTNVCFCWVTWLAGDRAEQVKPAPACCRFTDFLVPTKLIDSSFLICRKPRNLSIARQLCMPGMPCMGLFQHL